MNPRNALLSLNPVMRGLVGAYVVSGITHLVRPQIFEGIVPRALPGPRQLVYVSGVAELACAVGLLTPWTRRAASGASAALLVAVWPANVKMARQAHNRIVRRGSTPRREVQRVVTFARVPLQWPLIRASLDAARLG